MYPLTSRNIAKMHARSIIKALLAAFGATAAVAQTSTSSAAPSSTSIVPNIVDGHSNESAAIIPIDYSLARSIIPSNYSIMVDAYESLIPNWPKGKYPVSFSPDDVTQRAGAGREKDVHPSTRSLRQPAYSLASEVLGHIWKLRLMCCCRLYSVWHTRQTTPQAASSSFRTLP